MTIKLNEDLVGGNFIHNYVSKGEGFIWFCYTPVIPQAGQMCVILVVIQLSTFKLLHETGILLKTMTT